MSSAMKRPAAAQAAGLAKKPAQRDPALAKLKLVRVALAEAEGFPEQVTQAFGATLEHSLLVPAPDRHAAQTAVVDMIGDVVASVLAGCSDKAAAMSGKIAESDIEKGNREKAVAAAAEASSAKAAALEAAKVALTEATAGLAAATAALTEARAEQKTGDAAVNAAGDRKAQLEGCLTGAFAAVKDGDASALKAVLDTCRAFEFEQQLLVSAKAALAKTAAERGDFDGMVIVQVEQEFARKIAALAETLSEGAAGKAERASKVEAAERSMEAAAALKAACKAEADAAHVAVKEASGAAKAAEKALKDFGPEMKSAASDLARADADLQAAEGVMAAYAELRDRTSAAPPEPDPPAEPAAAEPAAAEPAADVGAGAAPAE